MSVLKDPIYDFVFHSVGYKYVLHIGKEYFQINFPLFPKYPGVLSG
jgi:hypothetical protein